MPKKQKATKQTYLPYKNYLGFLQNSSAVWPLLKPWNAAHISLKAKWLMVMQMQIIYRMGESCAALAVFWIVWIGTKCIWLSKGSGCMQQFKDRHLFALNFSVVAIWVGRVAFLFKNIFRCFSNSGYFLYKNTEVLYNHHHYHRHHLSRYYP